VFRQGLQVDPLSAELYYDLSLALARHGDASGAKRAIALAKQIDPDIIIGRPTNKQSEFLSLQPSAR
jgi:hypothetical protein